MTDTKKDERIIFRLPKNLAIYRIAILPLMKKDGLKEKALEVYQNLQNMGILCVYDETGSIGKRYRKQDENGTLFCICVDYQTLEDETVTIRSRDTMKQERIKIAQIVEFA